ncbi:hypothetical protein DPMN_184878 [Dreissena polymorpha]|uniref:Uncharacterized protein n=1 Tax=Dreissena polymorpha TaxID=45954 RepID=A0A9D4I894_DREPO|nr:hypothetical protein DPMN_184878 [Dreissena polymorpha]
MTWKRHDDQLHPSEIQKYSGINVPVLAPLETTLNAANTNVSELPPAPNSMEINESRDNRSNDTDLRLTERRYPLSN